VQLDLQNNCPKCSSEPTLAVSTIFSRERNVPNAPLAVSNENLSDQEPDGGKDESEGSVNRIGIHFIGPLRKGTVVTARSLAQNHCVLLLQWSFESTPIPAHNLDIGTFGCKQSTKFS
jgi:hypothetical protein